MITMHNSSLTNTRALFLKGLSTDTKPIETWTDTSVKPPQEHVVGNGSIFIEIDQKGKQWIYDETSKTWNEGGSGGGGGGDDPSNTASEEDIEGIIDSIWD